MRLVLKLHPDSRCDAVAQIDVEVLRSTSGAVDLHYFLSGAIDGLAVPPPAAARRADGLWKHTCCEAFFRAPGDEAYREYNFAPSTLWASYRFSGYRMGMTEAPGYPDITVSRTATSLRLRVRFTPDGMPPHSPWRLGLSAVVEEASGRQSYWALAHPPGRPDFHHADGFAVQLGDIA